MSAYRDDQEAAERRIEALLAKIAERETALAAQRAELAARDAELAALRAQVEDWEKTRARAAKRTR